VIRLHIAVDRFPAARQQATASSNGLAGSQEPTHGPPVDGDPGKEGRPLFNVCWYAPSPEIETLAYKPVVATDLPTDSGDGTGPGSGEGLRRRALPGAPSMRAAASAASGSISVAAPGTNDSPSNE
jgi:hypothetical protein